MRAARSIAVAHTADVESGRGLLIVLGPATRWAGTPRDGAPGKTVRAELRLA
ncbi:hypothetical protein [Streptomyces sp. LUP30]|uniref:hypothetical protein n=1 Tax=Streptomyces sp. LUP30 TaxID=1890285 RepID=UPI003522CA0F